jgi:hypothetical protein
LTDKDIEDYSFNKSEILGNNVKITNNQNQSLEELLNSKANSQKDHQFVNSDFEGTMSIPIQLLTAKGREQIGKAYEGFGQNMKGAIGGFAW